MGTSDGQLEMRRPLASRDLGRVRRGWTSSSEWQQESRSWQTVTSRASLPLFALRDACCPLPAAGHHL